MITLETSPRHREDLVWRKVDGEVVILTADGRNIHNLNREGSSIWELFDGKRSIKEIASLICERFDVPFEVAQTDVLEFGAQLVDKKLLEMTEK